MLNFELWHSCRKWAKYCDGDYVEGEMSWAVGTNEEKCIQHFGYKYFKKTATCAIQAQMR